MPRQSQSQHGLKNTSVAMLIKRLPVGQIATAATIARKVASSHHDQQALPPEEPARLLLCVNLPSCDEQISAAFLYLPSPSASVALLHEIRHTITSRLPRRSRLASRKGGTALAFSAARGRSGASSRKDTGVPNRGVPMPRLRHADGTGQPSTGRLPSYRVATGALALCVMAGPAEPAPARARELHTSPGGPGAIATAGDAPPDGKRRM